MQSSGTTEHDIKLINLILLPGLLGIVLALLTNNIVMAGAVVIFPLLLILSVQILQLPIILYFSVFTLNYFIVGVSRYMNIAGFSFLIDMLMVGTLVLIFIHTALLRNIEWKYAINVLTVGAGIWMIYCLAQIYNPTGMLKAWVLSRGLAINGFVIALIVSLLFNKYKWVKVMFIMLALFTLLAVFKALIQKKFGFDEAETIWLNDGAYKTHLLVTGTRYFSFFSDAGNFGSNMGCAGVAFGIAAFFEKKYLLKIFYGIVAVAGIYAMFLSGTRGSMIVPLAGLALLAIVSKNIKILISSSIVLIFIYVFFAFTSIGQDNPQIRRMRTAFTPTEDASYNVRKENKKILGEYLKNKPFGEGLGLSGVENQDLSMRLTTIIPHDSWYVKVWVETGIVGIMLYLSILFTTIGKGAWIIMFKIKNRELKGYLTGLLCGIFGMLISAYGNAFWGQFPTAIIAFSGLAIVLKGEHFDRELENNVLKIKHD